jgi:hypothetical protein
MTVADRRGGVARARGAWHDAASYATRGARMYDVYSF